MIVRAVALKDATSTGTACSCTGPGACTIVYLGGRACDVPIYAGLQLLSCTASGIKVWIQGNSSSGYTALNTGTDLVAFTSRACRDSQWAKLVWNCASATSTERWWYRAAWQQTCSQSNNWLAAMSVGEN